MRVLVIGAGAAGLAAARALREAGMKAVVVEAAGYVGGRMKTDMDYVNFPLELGAEFIHGNGAITHQLLAEAGLSSIPVDRYGNLWWAPAGQPAQLYTKLDSDTSSRIDRLFEDKHALQDATFDVDMSMEEFLRSRGRSDAEVALADVLLCQTQNATASSLSCADWAHEFKVDTAGDGESRVEQGYVSLLSWMQQGLTVHTNTPINILRWGGGGVVAESFNGTAFEADACIITASLAALQKGAISFQPALPDLKQKAIHALEMRPATKLIYHFRKQLWSDELTYMNHDGAAPRWWTPGYKREAADAVISAFITADKASAIDAMSESGALELGLTELSTLLGLDLQECKEQLVKACRVSWSNVPYVWGGYSSCPPGAHPMRFALAAATDGCLFWAGEATSHHSNPQTVHGAIDSGMRAAVECIHALKGNVV